MRIQTLELENFRNYRALKLDFSHEPVLALVGQNAQGKTNILEAVAFLALGKSFRSSKSVEALTWGENHGRVKGKISFEEDEKSRFPLLSLEVFLQRSPEKKVLKLQDKIQAPANFLGHLKVVLFTPEHLNLVTGSPALRRQLMDRLWVQLSPTYVEAIHTYQRVLKHRNSLLKSISHGRSELWELELWDLRLITEAQVLLGHRKELLQSFSAELEALYQDLAGTQDKLSLKPKLYENLEEDLIKNRRFDLLTKSTSVGPHREDFTLLLNGQPLAEIGSQGEKRTAVLALKLAEIHFIEAKSGIRPLLLLDDVLSELDSQRRDHLTEHLKNHQAILTTTSTGDLSHFKHVRQLEVKNGQIF